MASFKKGDPNNPGFKKGQSGNPSGRPKSNLLKLLREELLKKRPNVIGPDGKVSVDYKGKTNEELVIQKMLKLAIEGEHLETLKYIFDRMEGKMKDTVEMSGANGEALTSFTLKLGDKVND